MMGIRKDQLGERETKRPPGPVTVSCLIIRIPSNLNGLAAEHVWLAIRKP